MCINVKKGVTSFGRHTRPGCNLGHCRDLFCIKWCWWMILTSIQCVFQWLPVSPSCHFRWRHPSSLPMRGIWEHFGGSCLCSRFYSTPCFFESMATHARGLGRSLRFTHAQTNFMHVCAFLWMCMFFSPCQGAARWLVERGHVNKLMTYPHAKGHVTLKNNTPIVFLVLWLAVAWSSPVYYYQRYKISLKTGAHLSTEQTKVVRDYIQ